MKNLHTDDIERLLLVMEENAIEKLVVKSDDLKIKLKRNKTNVKKNTSKKSNISMLPSKTAKKVATKDDSFLLQNTNKEVAISSPVVGIYHAMTKLTVGHNVQSGQKLAYIDILGIKKEVVSNVSGIITHVHVEENAGVEYGETLLSVLTI